MSAESFPMIGTISGERALNSCAVGVLLGLLCVVLVIGGFPYVGLGFGLLSILCGSIPLVLLALGRVQ